MTFSCEVDYIVYIMGFKDGTDAFFIAYVSFDEMIVLYVSNRF